MTTRPLLLWWFTKDVLRRTTGGRTQLDEEDYDVDDEEGTEKAEAERRNRNRGIKVRVKGGSLVEEEAGRSLRRKSSLPRRARSRTHVSLLLYVSCGRQKKQFSGGCLFYLVMAITRGCKDPAPNLTTQKAPSLFFWRDGCC